MDAKPPSSTRVGLAFGVAVLADLIQLPLSAAFDTAILAIPAEAAILFVDFLAFVLTTALLRFHWMLLPSLAIEAIPNLDVIPTWTGCVAFVVWRRKRVVESDAEAKLNIPPKPKDVGPVIDV